NIELNSISYIENIFIYFTFLFFQYLKLTQHRTGHLHSDLALQSAFAGGLTGHGHHRFKHRLLRQCPGFGERLSTHSTGAFRISDHRQPKISVSMLLT
ncbi:hypothetical protein ACOIP5_005668, partial [Salmonella enterica]